MATLASMTRPEQNQDNSLKLKLFIKSLVFKNTKIAAKVQTPLVVKKILNQKTRKIRDFKNGFYTFQE